MGTAVMQTSVRNGIRQSSATAYLRSVAHKRRNKLHIVTDAHVTNILIKEREDGIKCAVGVQFHKNGKTISVNAKREVILSAGVYGTPQLLMLSGIAPAEHIQDHGIKLVKDLPGVGSNYLDHIFRPIYFYAKNSSFGDTSGIKEILYHLPGWIWKGNGPFGNTGGAVANLNFDKSNRRPTSPDIQLILIPVEADPFLFKTIVSNRNYKDDVFQHTSEKAKSERGRILFSYFINVVLLHPKSQGTVRLKSSDPFDKPRVDPNIFSNHKDLDTLIEEEFYKCLAIGESFFNYGCCTARMGVKEDGEAFVDPQLS